MTKQKFSEVLCEFLAARDSYQLALPLSMDSASIHEEKLGRLADKLDAWFEHDSDVIRVEDPVAAVRTDIVPALIKASSAPNDFGLDDKSLYRDAAGEIVRLRIALTAIRIHFKNMDTPDARAFVARIDSTLLDR